MHNDPLGRPVACVTAIHTLSASQTIYYVMLMFIYFPAAVFVLFSMSLTCVPSMSSDGSWRPRALDGNMGVVYMNLDLQVSIPNDSSNSIRV